MGRGFYTIGLDRVKREFAPGAGRPGTSAARRRNDLVSVSMPCYAAPFLAERRKTTKKSRWGLLQRHRPKNGIPKEEEEKPRKRILQEKLLRCNSFFCCIDSVVISASGLLIISIS